MILKLVLGAGLAVSAFAAAPQFQLRDTQGRVHTQAEWNGRKAIILFFVIPDCPVVNSYVPEMNRIHHDYATRGVLVYAVQADAGASTAATADYARDYRYQLPLLIDPRQTLVQSAGATVTPQAVVLSPEGMVLYRGRIDNRVEDFGSQRPEATVHELRNAVDDVLAGHPPRVPFTHSIGCAITQLKRK